MHAGVNRETGDTTRSGSNGRLRLHGARNVLRLKSVLQRPPRCTSISESPLNFPGRNFLRANATKRAAGTRFQANGSKRRLWYARLSKWVDGDFFKKIREKKPAFSVIGLGVQGIMVTLQRFFNDVSSNDAVDESADATRRDAMRLLSATRERDVTSCDIGMKNRWTFFFLPAIQPWTSINRSSDWF